MRQESGQDEHHQVNHSKMWEHQKQNCDQIVFWINAHMGSIYSLQEPFVRMIVSCDILLTTNRQKRTEIAWIISMNQIGSFEDKAKFIWQPLELLKSREALEYLLQPSEVEVNLIHQTLSDMP